MVLGGCTSGKVVGTGKPLSLALMLGLYRRKLCLYFYSQVRFCDCYYLIACTWVAKFAWDLSSQVYIFDVYLLFGA